MTQKIKTRIRKSQIATAALSLITIKGVKGLRIADVALQIGVVPSAIYRHFKGKEEIIEAIFDLIEETFQSNMAKVLKESLDPIEQLRALLTLHARFIQQNQFLPRAAFSEEAYQSHPELRARVHRIITTYLKKVAQIIRHGQQKGEIIAALDPATVSLMFLGLIQPAAIIWDLSQGRFDVKQHIEKAWEIFSRAIKN
jgi:TetR/AcrR family transcriptional regulator, fatty acid metabolism regulator protein